MQANRIKNKKRKIRLRFWSLLKIKNFPALASRAKPGLLIFVVYDIMKKVKLKSHKKKLYNVIGPYIYKQSLTTLYANQSGVKYLESMRWAFARCTLSGRPSLDRERRVQEEGK